MDRCKVAVSNNIPNQSSVGGQSIRDSGTKVLLRKTRHNYVAARPRGNCHGRRPRTLPALCTSTIILF